MTASKKHEGNNAKGDEILRQALSEGRRVATSPPSAAAKEKPRRRFVVDREWLRKGQAAEGPGPIKAPGCALRNRCESCGGKGYAIGTQGALARAELCACVRGCPACFGRGLIVQGNHSEVCRTPPPPVVVNMINAAQIPARYADASLARFQNSNGNGETFLGQLKRWKQRFQPHKGTGLVITGPVGVGKTYVLAALAKEFCERGMSVRFTDFFQLLGDLKSGFSEGKADASQLAPLIDVEVLFVDELGKGRNNDFELTILDQLVCGRYNQGKTIIATTNYLLADQSSAHLYNVPLDQAGATSGGFALDRFESLETRIGGRIYSRLREMTQFVELKGDDLRRRNGSR